MNKRGQFFLVAALVIAGILIGLAGVYTEVNTPKEDSTVYDLSSELNYENAQVIDQGIYADASQEDINRNVANLTHYYANRYPDNDFSILSGTGSSLQLIQCNKRQEGSAGINTGGTDSAVSIYDNRCKTTSISTGTTTGSNVVGNQITVTFSNGNSLTINLIAGQNNFVVIGNGFGNNQNVATAGSTTNTACSGSPPSGNGVIKGPISYPTTFTGTKSWNYKTVTGTITSASLAACQWTCDSHYERKGTENKCIEKDD